MENCDSFLCLPLLKFWQAAVSVDNLNSYSSPPHLHINVSCTTIHGSFYVIDEFSPLQVQKYEKEPQISSCICFHSFETFEETVTKLLTDWKIPLFFHSKIIAPITSRVHKILRIAPSIEGHRIPPLGVHISSLKLYAQDMRLLNLWMFKRYRELEEIIRDGMIPACPLSVKSLKRKKMHVENDTNGDLSCAICLEEFPTESQVTCMPCSHMFHDKCLTRWLQRSHCCPLCRFKMPTDEDLEKKYMVMRLFALSGQN